MSLIIKYRQKTDLISMGEAKLFCLHLECCRWWMVHTIRTNSVLTLISALKSVALPQRYPSFALLRNPILRKSLSSTDKKFMVRENRQRWCIPPMSLTIQIGRLTSIFFSSDELPLSRAVATSKIALQFGSTWSLIFLKYLSSRAPRLAVMADCCCSSTSWCIVFMAVGMITFMAER